MGLSPSMAGCPLAALKYSQNKRIFFREEQLPFSVLSKGQPVA